MTSTRKLEIRDTQQHTLRLSPKKTLSPGTLRHNHTHTHLSTYPPKGDDFFRRSTQFHRQRLSVAKPVNIHTGTPPRPTRNQTCRFGSPEVSVLGGPHVLGIRSGDPSRWHAPVWEDAAGAGTVVVLEKNSNVSLSCRQMSFFFQRRTVEEGNRIRTRVQKIVAGRGEMRSRP